MSNDRLFEKLTDPITGIESIRWYTSSELIDLGTDAIEYIAQLQEKERSDLGINDS